MIIYFQIDGWPKYFISRCGQVKSEKNVLKRHIRPDGYLGVSLYRSTNSGYERKHFLVHRLVAELFLPNPLKLPSVNHKNGDKSDDHADNLEWCTDTYNMKHAFDTGLHIHFEQKCAQYTLEDEFVAIFSSLKNASSTTGISYNKIAKACRGVLKTADGYKWKYVDKDMTNYKIITKDWGIIPEYPNYKVSKDGQVYSIGRGMLVPQNKAGYNYIHLRTDDNSRTIKVSRLVAITYLPNPNNYRCVNHINGNKSDDRIENLEWCTDQYNTQHAVDMGLIPKTPGKAVNQYDKNGKFLARFDSIKEAFEKTGASAGTIPMVCNGKRNISGGYKWKWAD